MLQGLAERVGCFTADLWVINICCHHNDTSTQLEKGVMENTFEQKHPSMGVGTVVQVRPLPNKKLWKFQGWSFTERDKGHTKSSGCLCEACKIPKGFWVGVFQNPGLDSWIIDSLCRIDLHNVIIDPIHALMGISELILWALIKTVWFPYFWKCPVA